MIVPARCSRMAGSTARTTSKSPGDVGCQLAVDQLRRCRLERAEGAEAGVVDDGIDAAEAVQRERDGSVDGGAVGHVKPGDDHVRCGGQRAGGGRVAHGGHHIPAAFGEQFGGGVANATGTAGNQDRFLHDK
ncbi:hypothetical protein OTB17_22990 [Massilia sp. H27-R4]|nr:hypothetical protein [Massilia sp. H27-R4]MCY0914525.1 hypothetical protein [Massilia sp. H27-R4]